MTTNIFPQAASFCRETSPTDEFLSGAFFFGASLWPHRPLTWLRSLWGQGWQSEKECCSLDVPVWRPRSCFVEGIDWEGNTKKLFPVPIYQKVEQLESELRTSCQLNWKITSSFQFIWETLRVVQTTCFLQQVAIEWNGNTVSGHAFTMTLVFSLPRTSQSPPEPA